LKSWKETLEGKFDLLSVSLWKLTFWRLLELCLLGRAGLAARAWCRVDRESVSRGQNSASRLLPAIRRRVVPSRGASRGSTRLRTREEKKTQL
jgi:hypothetical protein